MALYCPTVIGLGATFLLVVACPTMAAPSERAFENARLYHGMAPDEFREYKSLVQRHKQLVARKYGQEVEDVTALDEYEDGDVLHSLKDVQAMVKAVERELAARGQGQGQGHRAKRKVESRSERLWPGATVPFVFDGSHTTDEVAQIEAAMAMWETMTCVRFVENSAAPLVIITKGDNSRCSSYIGKMGTLEQPQPITLASGCFIPGVLQHELGHSLGFYHEHKRPDRDEFVTVLFENVRTGSEVNFEVSEYANPYGLPYDMASVMHYPTRSFSVDYTTKDTLLPNDPRFTKNLGQRRELSFRDAKAANLAYCSGACEGSPLPAGAECAGAGYQDPNDCSRCHCPDGFGGTFCDEIAPSSPDCDANLVPIVVGSEVTCRQSPSPIPPGTECNWHLEAPANHQIEYWFTELDMRCAWYTGGVAHFCRYDWVQVQDRNETNGPRYCCEETLKQKHRTSSNQAVVTLRTSDEPGSQTANLCFTQFYDPCATGEVDCSADAQCTPLSDGYSCQCNEGYVGSGTVCLEACRCDISRRKRQTCTFTPSSGDDGADCQNAGCCWDGSRGTCYQAKDACKRRG